MKLKTKQIMADKLLDKVVESGICTGCGACVFLDNSGKSHMEDTIKGPVPIFSSDAEILDIAWDVCPGKGFDYNKLSSDFNKAQNYHCLIGAFENIRIGYAANQELRRQCASGGIMTQVLIHLLQSGRIDAAVVVKQGIPDPIHARAVIATTKEEIIECAQSVYVPVSVLDILSRFETGKTYAMTCLPDQAVALRLLQQAGNEKALQVRYVLGPYTGTALQPGAIDCLLRSKGVKANDTVVDLKWRAGEWPGYLKITTASGKIIRCKKVYYNFLIPFYVTQASLQSMDFANEFTDLSVGDAWSPKYETRGGGFSVVTTRNSEMEAIIREMEDNNLICCEKIKINDALAMHGHMIDFKKRGSFIRNKWRRNLGLASPHYGIKPDPLPLSRYIIEAIVMTLFLLGRTYFGRLFVRFVPEKILGPIFNKLRLSWKALSKPAKRKGLSSLKMKTYNEFNL